MNARIPPELRKRLKATATRKGLTLSEYVVRVLSASVDSEALADKPDFLEAWEKFLVQYRTRSR